MKSSGPIHARSKYLAVRLKTNATHLTPKFGRKLAALNLASTLLPIAVFYTITNILIGKQGTGESTDPLIPFIVTGGAFTFAVIAMAIPLMSEFDVAVGRSSAIGE